ncbi:hypothetical protein [Bordetella trematum]|uniref:hypothetical protein n=1 Tax=Bordetella trematum TaxID=123899 RepID=UPI0013FD1B42|nr:hypothetical protein [Bordetella trematum]QIM72426.1 hypothetical protein EYB34_14260 [Bordetella trematum]
MRLRTFPAGVMLALLSSTISPAQAGGMYWGGLQLGHGFGYSGGPFFGPGFGFADGPYGGSGVFIGPRHGGWASGVGLGHGGVMVSASQPLLPAWPNQEAARELAPMTPDAAAVDTTSPCVRQAMDASGFDPANVNPWTTEVMVQSYQRALQDCRNAAP